MTFPEEYLFSSEHTWAFVEEGIATIGITQYAAEELNDILAVDLPGVGDTVELGDSFGTLESSKTVSDIISPLSGEIIEVNAAALEDPGIVNEYSYDDGWLIKVKMTEPEDLTALLNSLKYEAYLNEESEAVDDDDDFEDDDEDI